MENMLLWRFWRLNCTNISFQNLIFDYCPRDPMIFTRSLHFTHDFSYWIKFYIILYHIYLPTFNGDDNLVENIGKLDVGGVFVKEMILNLAGIRCFPFCIARRNSIMYVIFNMTLNYFN